MHGVNGLLHSVFDDSTREAVVWMPAHTKESEVGTRIKSDGSTVTRGPGHERQG